jgi:soluble lytic murein transglycosylase-like protein
MSRQQVWLSLVGLLLPVGAGQPAQAAIFAFTDAHGTVHYSNVPVDSRYLPVLQDPGTAADTRLPSISQLLLRSDRYSTLIAGAARSSGLEPALVQAVLVAESGADPQAVSPRGASGLMQLMPATARQYGVRDIFDPEQNIRAGTQYLRDLKHRYGNDLRLVLAAYNAGPGAVDQNRGAVPPLKETLEYVPRVLKIYQRLLDEPRRR